MKFKSTRHPGLAARVILTVSGALLLCSIVLNAGAQSTPETCRALQKGAVPNDWRLGPLKDLEGYFPFTPSGSPAEWTKRAERVRRDVAVSVGLWPMPEKTPLNPVIHGKIECEDYTVEKVYFESLPGFYVTGNLYRPKGRIGKLPAVLSPHGHWPEGRFIDVGVAAVQKQIVRGEERFEQGGRSPLQARCVQLARMGCLVFHYDMIGYADSVQIPESVAHGFSKQRPEMNGPANWGLFSPQAEEHLQSVMGLHTWNSIRALDFLASLPEVDSTRLGVTGASGGGTQTFILCALDGRPAAAFPAVMVSTAMQGGCTCENACLLRVGTCNVEIAALFAPKPLGLTSADDWTLEMPAKGFPELQRHYAMLGEPGNVILKPLSQFKHNYNYMSRAAMYGWFNRHLKLGLDEPVIEKDYRLLSRGELTVWNEEHRQPAGGPEFESQLLAWITARDQKQLATCQATFETFREVYGGALEALIGRSYSQAGEVSFKMAREFDRGKYSERIGLLKNATYGEELPVTILEPEKSRKQAVIWADAQGKSALFLVAKDGKRRLRPSVQQLLSAGITVISADLLFQGEFLKDDAAVTHARLVSNPREAAAYTFGYNPTLFAHRVHDLMTVIQHVRGTKHDLESLCLVGVNGAGPWAAAAKAQARQAIDGLAVDTGGFRFINVTGIRDVNFLPGAAKYGDLPGMLALAAPGRLWLSGEAGKLPDLVAGMFRKAGAEGNITLAADGGANQEQQIVSWLLRSRAVRN